MSGYLKFNKTGNVEFDSVLDAIECAGDFYHHTSQWQDKNDGYNDERSELYKINALIDKLAEHEQPAPSQSESVAKIVNNQAGQICIFDNKGNPFDMSKYIGCELYTKPQPTPIQIVGERNTHDILCERKTQSVIDDGYRVAGYVLHKDESWCVINGSAVRWLSKNECWNLMHQDSKDSTTEPKPQTTRQDAINAERYRWLRDKAIYCETLPTAWAVYGGSADNSAPCDGSELDDEIDAAMKESK